MKSLVSRYRWYALAGIVLCLGSFFIFHQQRTPDWTTTKVDRGDVTESVTVSGFVKAKNTARLGFPGTGVIGGIFVNEGDTVKPGTLLATLSTTQLAAARSAAAAAVSDAQANRTALIEGPTSENRAITDTTVTTAKAALAETTKTEAQKVQNAHTLLLSSGLEAISDNPNSAAAAPTISGTYTCDTTGTYTIDTYQSSALSGYSYHYTGLESGTAAAYTDHPAPLGTCGLYIQFSDTSQYSDTTWHIDIPNTHSATYLTYKTAYELALQQQRQNVQAAKDALALATKQASAANATPRVESLKRADAAVTQAQAKLKQIDAQIADQSIAAPFAGMITSVDAVPGEIGSSKPIITLLAQDAFTLTARVPEIDIAKLKVGQPAHIHFDAAPDETLTGHITFISPLATEIDGVAYFETTIELDQPPTWIKAGLNADIDIVTADHKNVLRIPKRYLTDNTKAGTSTVLVASGRQTVSTPVTINFSGNDGYVSITGLTEGDTLVAPNQ